jgi:HEAT repeat protein
MRRITKYIVAIAVIMCCSAGTAVGQLSVEQAWDELPRYQYGQDMAALLAVERSVIEAMGTPARRAETAARLARLLRQPDTTPAAWQFICLQLRQIGTPAEIPLLSQFLQSPDTYQMALYAIAAIPGQESIDALRSALEHLQGEALAGAINALRVKRDTGCVDRLIQLAEAPDESVRQAALRALSNIADDRAIGSLRGRAAKEKGPLPSDLASCLLHAACVRAESGNRDDASSMYAELAAENQRPATRRAALEGMLRLDPTTSADTIRKWFVSGNAVERQVAARHLSSLPDAALDELSRQIAVLPDTSSVALIDVLASRRQQNLLPLLLKMVESDVPDVQLAGLRYLGALRDASTIPTLIDHLSAREQVAAVAQQALARLPRDVVGPALLTALQRRETRGPVIAVLKELKYYEAIDPLLAIASETDAAVYGPALDGLRSIADPDQSDMPRLVELLYRTQPGTHRDEVEKTIAIVCDKLPAGTDRAQGVFDLLSAADDARKVICLPLLGRLGGAQARRTIESYLESQDNNASEAAVRALCNWPNAEVADRLLALATNAGDKRYCRSALRAYVRVISLPSDRPPSETLAMLQEIMRHAQEADDRALIISRAATVRTMECVRWVADYLDDASLAQTACVALVELAHHRELRHPHMEEFGPLLDRVANISKDAAVVERAKRYRLGL